MLEGFDAPILGRAHWGTVSMLLLCDKTINGNNVVMGRAPNNAGFAAMTACE